MKFAYDFIVIIFGVLLIYAGLRYNFIFFRDRFSATGALPLRYELAILAADVFLVLSGAALLWFRKRLRKSASEFLVVVGAFAVCLAFLEVGFRVYLKTFAPQAQARFLAEDEVSLSRRFVRHPFLGYVNTPSYASLDDLTRHNALGFRGEDVTVPKPAGVYRIVFVGGSTTYSDYIRDDKRTWVYETQRRVRAACGIDTVEVVNGAVGGYDSYQTLINIQFRVLDLEPDLIVVHHGVNEAHARMVRPEYYRGDNSGRRRPWSNADDPWFMSSVTIRMALTALTGEPFEPAVGYYFTSPHSAAGVRDPGYNDRLGDTPMNVLKRNPPVYYSRNLRNMVAVARANGADILFVTWPYSTAHDDFMTSEHYRLAVDEINNTTVNVGRRLDVFVYRLHDEMPTDAKYWVENRHVNEEGARVKAELTAKGIAEYVCPRARRRASGGSSG